MTREITKLQAIGQYILYKKLRASAATGHPAGPQARSEVIAGTDCAHSRQKSLNRFGANAV
jgi:hypothetical protein